MKRRGIRVAAAVVVAGAVGFGACARARSSETREVSPPAPSAAPAPHRVRVAPELVATGRIALAPVERRTTAGMLRLAGEVVPSPGSDAEAGALVAGRVASIEVAEGAHVDKGQTLAWVDAPEVAKVAAEVLRARARAEVAAHKLARQRELEAQNATSRNAVDEASAEDRIAKADLFAARTQLASLGAPEPGAEAASRSRPFRVPVRAPIAGIVVERSAIVGAPVTPDRSMFRIVGAGLRVVRAMLPETARDAFDPTRPAAVVPRTAGGEPSDRRCSATLRGGVGIVEDASRAIPLRFEPDAPCDWLLPGGYVDVVVATHDAGDGGAEPVTVVPRGAVVEVKGVPTAFVAGGEPGTFEPRVVRTGPSVGDGVVVEAGLSVGEQVVVRGSLLLKGELLRSELGGE